MRMVKIASLADLANEAGIFNNFFLWDVGTVGSWQIASPIRNEGGS